jgi:glutamine amidotransferase
MNDLLTVNTAQRRKRLVVIVDYDGGNLRSVKRACDAIGIDALFSQDPEIVARAEKLILPGVGNAKSAMETLNRTGLSQAIEQAFYRGVPILGICVGAQIILERSEEGDVPCFGFIRGKTRRLRPPPGMFLKIPHMGWNEVRVENPHPLLKGIKAGDEFYFVHSYFPDPDDTRCVFATSDHGIRFCCAIGHDNLFATQFHPEKSGTLGLAMLRRFADWNGSLC